MDASLRRDVGNCSLTLRPSPTGPAIGSHGCRSSEDDDETTGSLGLRRDRGRNPTAAAATACLPVKYTHTHTDHAFV